MFNIYLVTLFVLLLYWCLLFFNKVLLFIKNKNKNYLVTLRNENFPLPLMLLFFYFYFIFYDFVAFDPSYSNRALTEDFTAVAFHIIRQF
jgi:hypothetical protein